MIVIKYSGREYAAELVAGKIMVYAGRDPVLPKWLHSAVYGDEESARRWLSSHGLRKSKARQLLAAALRSEGPFADPDHPQRVQAVFNRSMATV